LDDYLRITDPVSSASHEAVLERIATSPALFLDQLFEQTREECSRDEIYRMIATSMIHIDWNAVPITEPERVHVFADRETAIRFHAASQKIRSDIGIVDICTGTSLSWDGKPWTILNVGNNNISLIGDNKNVVELPILAMEILLREGRLLSKDGGQQQTEHPKIQNVVATASPRDLKIANKRAKIVQDWLSLDSDALKHFPGRTLRRHISNYRIAQEAYGNGYIGLIPQIGKRGNRTARMSDESRLAMDESIKVGFEKGEQPTIYSCWSIFKDARESINLPYPTYRTYCKAVAVRPRHKQAVARKGTRAAYRHEEFYWNLERQTPRHGDRPFEVVHIDHTELDVENLSRELGQKLGRAWFTTMIDASTRSCLAFYLTFDEPSYRSCMMVIRECVRRHHRLPQIIVIDGGREFASTYFDQVLARYEVTKKTRPPAKARYGSVCERLFGTTNTQFIHNLRGNTQIMKEVRQVTKTNNPKESAIWDFATLDHRLRDYLYDVYDTMDHPTLGQSPRDAFNAGVNTNGTRGQKYILYDTAFLMTTAPSTKKGTAMVHPGRGVTINYFRYWCEAFRDPLVENRSLPVRYDPYDMGIAWVFVRGRWVECHSQFHAELKGRSEREIKIAARKLLDQMRLYSQTRMTITASKLAAFLRNVKQDEDVLLQRLRDQESRSARERLGSQKPMKTQGVPEASEAADIIITKESFRDVKIYGAL
jgi:transposase InsO family protein